MATKARPNSSSAQRLRLLHLEALETREVLASHLLAPAAAVRVADVSINDPGSIRGIIFDDLNGNGRRDEGETGLVDRTVFLDANGDGALGTEEVQTKTDADGAYTFTGVPVGRHRVARVLPPGWQASDSRAYLSTPTDAANKLIGLQKLQADTRFWGVDGSGYSVVVIDTGIAGNQPAFEDAIAYEYDFANDDAVAEDISGHGTHIAGIIASRDPSRPGIAPGANIIALKGLKDDGSGDFTQIEKALQWVLANADTHRVAVVNLSFGDGGNYATATQMQDISDELEQLVARGIMVVAATGNNQVLDGESPGVGYPAADPNVIAVGAVWARNDGPAIWEGDQEDHSSAPDRIVSFSQRVAGINMVFAPGTNIVGPGLDPEFSQTLSGTSQAAAYISGMVTLAQQVAERSLGRRLTLPELRQIFNETGQAIHDGDDEEDNVQNTDADYRRPGVYALVRAILRLPGAQWTPYANAGRTVEVSTMEERFVEFADFKGGVVSGRTYEDKNGDGQRQPEEPAIAGRAVYIDSNRNGQWDADERKITTDATGRYEFTDLAAGDIEIRQLVPDGWQDTIGVRKITVTEGMELRAQAMGSRPENYAPELTGDGRLTTILEDSGAGAGQTVTSILDGTLRDADQALMRGIAVVGGTPGAGRWHYTLDGTNWQRFGPVSQGMALLLPGTARIRFVPNANFNGAVTMTYYGWDRSTGQAGAKVDLSGAGKIGGTTAFSANTAAARLTVQAVNDAPQLAGDLRANRQAMWFTRGDLVGDIVGPWFRDVDAGARAGMAVVDFHGEGRWQYSTDNGSTWNYMGPLTAGKARLLRETDRVRFVPMFGWAGVARLTFRAWDVSAGTPGSIVDVVRTGADSAFSSEQATATVRVV